MLEVKVRIKRERSRGKSTRYDVPEAQGGDQ
jgi:hypothetical protein